MKILELGRGFSFVANQQSYELAQDNEKE